MQKALYFKCYKTIEKGVSNGSAKGTREERYTHNS